MVSHTEKGIWPVHGGLLDQSAWFISLWSAVVSDENKIERERMKRAANG
jgi:hypothetical protein